MTSAQAPVIVLEEVVLVYLSSNEAGDADHPRRLPQTGNDGCRSHVERARVRSDTRSHVREDRTLGGLTVPLTPANAQVRAVRGRGAGA